LCSPARRWRLCHLTVRRDSKAAATPTDKLTFGGQTSVPQGQNVLLTKERLRHHF
jgi:hypothetical protein